MRYSAAAIAIVQDFDKIPGREEKLPYSIDWPLSRILPMPFEGKNVPGMAIQETQPFGLEIRQNGRCSGNARI